MAESLHYYPGHFHKASDIVPGTSSSGGGGLLIFIKNGKAVYQSEAWGATLKLLKTPEAGLITHLLLLVALF